MACIKGVNRSATVAFSPELPYLAAGTMAGAVDLSFSSSANIDIFQLDFASDDPQLIHNGSAPSSERFNRLSWGKPVSGSEEFSLGIVAGGLVDGNIGLWNPKALISPQGSESALAGNLSRHKGPVRGLEFNAHNLLASGSDEGEICIWDIAKPAEPTHFPPLKGSGSATQDEISFLSWNRKVVNILASTSFNGTTVVWDLKKQKPAISFADSARRRCSVLQWNPDIPTQMIVASDDDNSPTLRLWDMRNIMSPVKEFVGHTKGIIAMSWCPSDSSYLLTCAKDNRTICWDINSGEIVSELPDGTNWNFDVHWYPKIFGVISASSFDGKIGIYNIEGCSRYGTGEADFGSAPLRPPKWYKRKAGVSFGFGGKLVSFRSTEAPAGFSEVYVHKLVTEDGLVNRSTEFENAIMNGEKSSLRLFCEKKSEESVSEDERETWGFLKVMFEDEGTARTKLLSHLGFSMPLEEKDAPQDEITDKVDALVLDKGVTSKTEYGTSKESNIYETDNGEDFFNNLPSPKADTPLAPSGNNLDHDSPVPATGDFQADEIEEESADPSFDDAVQRALVAGDYKGAVELCITTDRMADALVIAHAGGASLMETTRDQYLKKFSSPYLKVVSAIVNNDLASLVNTRPLRSWKETLALFCTFAQPEQWSSLCDTLGSKLLAAGNILAATLCYICAGNIDKIVGIWSKTLASDEDGKSYVDLLQALMEKTLVFALATGQKQSDSLFKLVEKYAEILASQGQLDTAMEYLKLMGTEELSPELLILRDRIACATESDKGTDSVASDNSQYQTQPTYGGDQTGYGAVDSSQHYYPEAPPAQMQSSVSNSPYTEQQYQQQQQQSYGASYARDYGAAPGSYQNTPKYNTPQPNMFIPSQAPQQVPQGNFTPPPPISTRPPSKPFVPSNPPVLRNVEQYQQPTLGSQLYPASASPSFQAGPPGPGPFGPNSAQVGHAPSQKMPQGVAHTQAPRGFMPVTSTGGPRPGMNPGVSPMHSSSPTHVAPVQTAVTPPAPPPTVQTADTSNVPAHQKPVIATLTRLFNETSEALGGNRANPAKKREIEDNSKKFGALFAKLNSGDISKNAADKLSELCKALDMGDFSTALQIQVQLTTSDWDECNFWLATLKRMIKTRQSLR